MEGALEGNALAVMESEESDLDALERREVVDVEVCLDDDEEVRVESDELGGLGGEADGVFALGVREVCGEYLGVREVRRGYLGVRSVGWEYLTGGDALLVDDVDGVVAVHEKHFGVSGERDGQEVLV